MPFGFADLFGVDRDDLTTPEGYYKSPELMRGSGEHAQRYGFPARSAQEVQQFMAGRMAEQPGAVENRMWSQLTPDRQQAALERWRQVVSEIEAKLAAGIQPPQIPEVREYAEMRNWIPKELQ